MEIFLANSVVLSNLLCHIDGQVQFDQDENWCILVFSYETLTCCLIGGTESGMQQLEARARQLAEESMQEKAAAEKKLLFVRYKTFFGLSSVHYDLVLFGIHSVLTDEDQ